MSIACGGRPYERGEFAGFFAEGDRVFFRVPVGVGSTERGGPFKLKVASERHFDFQRLLGLDFEQNYCTRLIHGYAQSFPHTKRIAGVEDRGRFRFHGERAGQCFGGQCAIADMKCQMEITENLQRIDPGLEASGLIAEQARARADDREKLPAADGARQFQLVSGLLSDARNRAQKTKREHETNSRK